MENVVIAGFWGEALTLAFAPGVYLRGTVEIRHCGEVSLQAASLGDACVYPTGAQTPVTARAVQRLTLKSLYLSGYRGRSTATDGSEYCVQAQGCNTVIDGCGMEYSGGTSLICACNGRFYGGGFNPIPDSRPDNGKLEFLVVRDVSRLTFIRLVGKYAKGRYRELANLITHLEGGHLEIDSETELVVNIDGEALWSKHVNFDLIPGGVNFLVPANMAFFHPETAGGHETREFVHA